MPCLEGTKRSINIQLGVVYDLPLVLPVNFVYTFSERMTVSLAI